MIFATGGSGGHLFPALQVAQELVKEGNEIIFCGSFKDLAKKKIESQGFQWIHLPAKGLSFKNVKVLIGSVIAMLQSVIQSLKIVKDIHPKVVVGFGGYGAFPVVLSAKMLRYRTLIHEQNVIPGKANALLAKLVNKIAISFSQSTQHFNSNKTVLTGCPCNLLEKDLEKNEKIIESAYKYFNFDKNIKTLFVLGGSQGSTYINDMFLQTIPLLKKQRDFQVIHVSGGRDYEKLKKAYKELGIRVALFPFLDKIREAYQCADLIISRAGAVTITEISLAKIPAILIPYPHAGGHQKYNAQVLCNLEVACMIEEKELSVEGLKSAIFKMMDKKNISTQSPTDAVKELIKVIKGVADE